MVDTKVSQLTEVVTATPADEIFVNDGGVSKKITVDNLSKSLTVASQSTIGGMSAVDKTKLDNIEALADVTDAINVALAGAVMDSDVSASEGYMRKTGAGTYEAIKTNLSANVNPTVNEDSNNGYTIGSIWLNTTGNNAFMMLDATVGAAVWSQIDSSVGGGDLLASNNLSDLNNAITATQNLSVEIGVDVQAFNTALTGTTGTFLTADQTKLDAIEVGADVTDAINVATALSNGVAALTSGEVTQLANIGAESISATEWGFVASSTAAFTSTLSGNITTNNAKVSNATHTGDVTGATALTIATDAVTYAKMQNVVADGRLLGNVAGAGGVVAELDQAAILTFLGGVEVGADVTDAINVATAGAVMDGDISEGEGFLRKTGVGAYVAVKTNLNSAINPGTSDDNTTGYAIGSVWLNTTTNNGFICLNALTGVAVWKTTTAATGTGDLIAANNLSDLNNAITATQNLSVEIGVDVQAFNTALTGTTGTFLTADQTKLDAIEALADVTDAINVATALTNGVAALTSGEVTQLANIGAESISATEWGFVASSTAAFTSTLSGNITTNNAKVSNATHTGDVTGNTALTISAAAVNLSMVSIAAKTEVIMLAISDETTDLTTGTAKVTFRMPYAFTLTDIRASVTTAPTGSGIIVDVNDSALTIMATAKLLIDATEKTTETAVTAPVITDTVLANDAEITIDIDQIGSTLSGAGLKVYLIGYQT